MTNLFDSYRIARDEYFSHVAPEFLALYNAHKPISWEEWTTFRMNRYECNLLQPLLDTPALVRETAHYLNNCQVGMLSRFKIPRTYDEAVMGRLTWLLLDRLDQQAPECPKAPDPS